MLSVPPKGVLANDLGIGDHGLIASLEPGDANQPKHGTVELKADGSFTYKPTAGYSGPDSFVYCVMDNSPALNPGDNTTTPLPAAYDVAKVWINVRPSPVVQARGDGSDARKYAPRGCGAGRAEKRFCALCRSDNGATPLGSNFAPTPFPLVAVLLTEEPPVGLSLNADGSLKYEPPKDFQGDVRFKYQARLVATAGLPTAAADAVTQGSDIATVVIHVRQLPDARDDHYIVAQNGVLSVPPKGVLANDLAIREHGLAASLELEMRTGRSTARWS